MTKFGDIFEFQDKYKYLAHIKDNREETLEEHTELANKYFEKIIEYKNLKLFFTHEYYKIHSYNKNWNIFYNNASNLTNI